MNIYDFDNTIYDGNCSVDFFLFCIKKDPKLIKYAPKHFWDLMLYKLHFFDAKIEKGKFTTIDFLRDIKDVDSLVEEFWIRYDKKINFWYPLIHTKNDIIISASPEFLLAPICEKLGVKHYIGSLVDKKTGVLDGRLCYQEEKVRRFNEKYSNYEVENVYIDSYEKNSFSNKAKNVYLVEKTKLKKIK